MHNYATYKSFGHSTPCKLLVVIERLQTFTSKEFDFCDRESDCRQGEFCFQNQALDKGICVNKIAKTVDSVMFDPLDVNIVNERPIALPWSTNAPTTNWRASRNKDNQSDLKNNRKFQILLSMSERTDKVRIRSEKERE